MFRDDDPVLAQVRDIALAFPEAFEKISHGRPAFFVSKMFAMYGGSARPETTGDHIHYPQSLMVKVDESDRRALEQDPRFATNPDRVAHAQVLYPLLEQCFAARGNAEWMTLLDAAGIPCAPVQDVAGMLQHPQTQALGLLQEVPGSSIPLLGLPMRFDGRRPLPRGASPALGEMNASADAPARSWITPSTRCDLERSVGEQALVSMPRRI